MSSKNFFFPHYSFYWLFFLIRDVCKNLSPHMLKTVLVFILCKVHLPEHPKQKLFISY